MIGTSRYTIKHPSFIIKSPIKWINGGQQTVSMGRQLKKHTDPMSKDSCIAYLCGHKSRQWTTV
jgi:hypothetical protein